MVKGGAGVRLKLEVWQFMPDPNGDDVIVDSREGEKLQKYKLRQIA